MKGTKGRYGKRIAEIFELHWIEGKGWSTDYGYKTNAELIELIHWLSEEMKKGNDI